MKLKPLLAVLLAFAIVSIIAYASTTPSINTAFNGSELTITAYTSNGALQKYNITLIEGNVTEIKSVNNAFGTATFPVLWIPYNTVTINITYSKTYNVFYYVMPQNITMLLQQTTQTNVYNPNGIYTITSILTLIELAVFVYYMKARESRWLVSFFLLLVLLALDITAITFYGIYDAYNNYYLYKFLNPNTSYTYTTETLTFLSNPYAPIIYIPIALDAVFVLIIILLSVLAKAPSILVSE